MKICIGHIIERISRMYFPEHLLYLPGLYLVAIGVFTIGQRVLHTRWYMPTVIALALFAVGGFFFLALNIVGFPAIAQYVPWIIFLFFVYDGIIPWIKFYRDKEEEDVCVESWPDNVIILPEASVCCDGYPASQRCEPDDGKVIAFFRRGIK